LKRAFRDGLRSKSSLRSKSLAKQGFYFLDFKICQFNPNWRYSIRRQVTQW
jgi:hypothetical protein